jgi:hypothetical protein
MKKETKIFLFAVAVAFLILIVFLIGNYNSTGKAIAINPENAEDPLGIGLNPESIPQTNEEANDKWAYIKQRAGEKILANPIIKSFHTWSLNHPGFYQVLFNEDYVASLKFFLTFLIWIFLLIFIANIMEGEKFFGFGGSFIVGLPIGIGVSVVLSHILVIRGIVNIIMKLINFAKDAWWKELLVWMVLIVIFVIIYYLGGMLKSYRKQKRKDEERAKEKGQLNESQEFIKGVKEGQDITKDLRVLRKKMLGMGREGI